MSTSKTGISWTDRTWNCVRGCSIISPGCRNCYAMREAWRFRYLEGNASMQSAAMVPEDGPFANLTRMTEAGPKWTGLVKMLKGALGEPMGWRIPSRIFVNSMSDLFHEAITDDFIDAVFGVMAFCRQHTFQILTKRPERMMSYIEGAQDRAGKRFLTPAIIGHAACHVTRISQADKLNSEANRRAGQSEWPLPNVWLGVSVENQAMADYRIPILLRTPAALRFVSIEPLLEMIDIKPFLWQLNPPTCRQETRASLGNPALDWAIIGGESGPNARFCELEWIRLLVAQARAAELPVFVKQLGARSVIERRDETHWSEQRFKGDPAISSLDNFPDDLRIQEFPRG